MSEIVVSINGVDPLALLGENNKKLNILREAYPDAKITQRGTKVKITADKSQAQQLKHHLELMMRLLQDNRELSKQTVEDIMAGENPFVTKLGNGASNKTILYGRTGKPIKARTANQAKLVESAATNDIVFAIGPAGTGKTYTAVALAVRALKNKAVKKIILTRPAVEAGESLGFLPGDLQDKIDPYLRPLYDALDDMIPAEKQAKFREDRTIEIAPLAYMRGRTLDNCFVIMDEAQNTTTSQIKMFLTRLGPSAKAIITGDLSQVDLPHNQVSGLRRAVKLLSPIKGIGTVRLTADDVVRHRLVKSIIKAYDAADEEEGRGRFSTRQDSTFERLGPPGKRKNDKNEG
ncbi:PhoH family protein [Neolewinella agarilytica]|uniref:PhoH-like protein n=1 Tax=Neolewinella agarilytica TaxID=478744 RepID=A0A1H9IMT8_9BACT|nr:PhoH family protein [Neolewinella agarilytica]SEQ75876.1 phosphate starvation-inducible protein PhoH [Neolewinella agarilytica]